MMNTVKNSQALPAESRMQLTVVIPVLNEASNLARLRQQIHTLVNAGCEVVVADGGSNDASLALATEPGVYWLSATRGRASQMNAGAALASREVILFLHADTQLPDTAIADIASAVAGPAACWGRFDVVIAGRSRLLPVIAAMMNLRSRISGIATGDQAVFVRRDVFAQLGGFPQQDLMEDIELSWRLRKHSRPVNLRTKVVTSGRRWDDNGACKTILLMWHLRLLYSLGTPAAELAKRYRR
ncbi:TIGR04283 family arsenosugar biosynthesis glycosyltransferase [Allopusillimonas ginsengisoli]|uniref:TIGR04283 family arsenosugar biosynthesis glycosyltransferase n=1 Tax=Allopusillimonas ginsengisoli TaxID=453575 RepID=UPI002897C576